LLKSENDADNINTGESPQEEKDKMSKKNSHDETMQTIIREIAQEEVAKDLIAKWFQILGEPLIEDDADDQTPEGSN